MEFLINFLMFFGFLFLMVIGLGQIIQPQNRGAENYLFSLSFIGQGLFILMLSLYSSGLYPELYPLILILIPASYLFTPLLILRYIWLFSSRYSIRQIHYLMFLPPLFVFIYCLYGLYPGAGIEEAGYLRPMILTDPSFMDIPLYWRGIYILIAGAKLYFVISITPMLMSIFFLWIKGRTVINAGLLRVGSFFLFIMNLTVLSSFAGNFISVTMIKGSVITANILICIHYIVSQKHPDYIRMVKIVIHKAKYAQSYIKGIDIDSLKNRLYEIMELEKAFADEDINLKRIADELGISTHQLSQILNEKIKKNFNTFVNEFRVNEAKQILLDEPDRSILSISFAVGFNSYVTFCNVFSKIAGMTPSQYRKGNKR